MRIAVPGSATPLGVTLVEGGVNVAVHSANAEAIDFCLFDAVTGAETERIRLGGRDGDVHHGFVPGVAAHARYGLRAHGPWDPARGHRFNAAKLLFDPYARAMDRPFALHPSMFGGVGDWGQGDTDSGPYMPKGLVLPDPGPFSGARPDISWGESIIYEMHVRGFTRAHPSVPERLRGTFAGLAHEAAVQHLVSLGVTAVELLPVMAWADEPHLLRAGLTNYWGYNTVGWCVPDPRLAPGGIAEVRSAVAALHAAGIEVLLDVVYNHSGEGNGTGPTLSLRGLDNALYYRTVPHHAHRYVDDTGCGNTLAFDRAPVAQLAVDSLLYWANATGVDGFRFDLAPVLGRSDHGFNQDAPLLASITHHPQLRNLKLIAEPWDPGPGGYQTGAFPATWGEWNDKYRDTVRRFWRGDPGQTGPLATRLAGSADVFSLHGRTPSRSVNFITAHDGFTLADLVSHGQKHNEANGESNLDGTNANYSWNHGVEGPTDDAEIVAARRRDVRALLATLMVSRGTPMLTMGDELGRTQRGNNNAYCQDNARSWVDWAHADLPLFDFTAALIKLRRAHPALRADRRLHGRSLDSTGIADVEWHRVDGEMMTHDDWVSGAHRTCVAVVYETQRLMVVIHGGDDTPTLRLARPRAGQMWHQLVDTAVEPGVFEPARPVTEQPIAVAPRSVQLFIEIPISADEPR